MKTGVCPKCSKREVRHSPPCAMGGQGNSLVISVFNFARLHTYCCTACGYVERYIDDPKKLASIAEKWERAR